MRAPTTVGLASSFGAGFPLTAAGVKCHSWCSDAAFAVVIAVAVLTEACCGPCRYCGQSVDAARAGAGRAAAMTSPKTPIEWRTSRTSGPSLPAACAARLPEPRGSCDKAPVRSLLAKAVDVDVPLGEPVGERPAPDRHRPVAAVVPARRDRGGEPADRDLSGAGAA